MLLRDDLLIRRLEAEILDRRHLGHAIFRRGQQTAVSHVLKVFGDLLRDYTTRSLGRPVSSLRTIAQMTYEATEHSLRWVLTQCPIGAHRPGVDWKKKDEEALTLLQWGISYAHLYVDHTAWSRGVMSASVDEGQKVVQFEPLDRGVSLLLDQLESDRVRSEQLLDSMPKSVEEELFRPWFGKFRGKDILELPELPLDEHAQAYKDTDSWASATILPEIAGSRDLGGFTLSEFRQFYVRLWLYCHCISLVEDQFDQALGHEHVFGSRLLQGRRERIVFWLSRHCKLHREVAERIVEKLTFACSQRHPSLPGHPFVPTADLALTLLARQFALTDPNVMIATALNTGPTRCIYEELVGEIEIEAKSRLARHLIDHGFAVWEEPELPRDGMNPLTPDLVVGRSDDDVIAVVEYKHALPPRGPAGVSDRIKETAKWVDKARQYLSVADREIARLEKRLGIGSRSRSVFVALVARWPMPVPLSIKEDRIHLTDLARVQHQSSRHASVRETFEPSASDTLPNVRYEFHDIQVDEWTYKHPILALETDRVV